MPSGDGTGPMGQGSLTGRGRGFCAGFNAPGFMNGGFGRGRGFGVRRGFGRGFGWGFQQQFVQPVQYSEADEKKILQEELLEIEAEKAEIQKRLKELK